METEYAIGVKRKGDREIHFLSSGHSEVAALRVVNRLNCTKGLKTGDLYVMEEVQK